MRFLIILILSSISYFSIGQSSFEGQVELDIFNYSTGEISTMHWWTKGGNFLIEVNSKTKDVEIDYQLLIKANDPNMIMLTNLNGEKKYYKVAVPIQQLKVSDTPFANAYFEASDAEKNILKSNCTQYLAANKEVKGQFWIGENDQGLTMNALPPILQSVQYMLFIDEHLSGTQLPMEVKTSDKDGFPLFGHAFKMIKKENVQGVSFEIPSGYQSGN